MVVDHWQDLGHAVGAVLIASVHSPSVIATVDASATTCRQANQLVFAGAERAAGAESGRVDGSNGGAFDNTASWPPVTKWMERERIEMTVHLRTSASSPSSFSMKRKGNDVYTHLDSSACVFAPAAVVPHSAPYKTVVWPLQDCVRDMMAYSSSSPAHDGDDCMDGVEREEDLTDFWRESEKALDAGMCVYVCNAVVMRVLDEKNVDCI